MVEKRKNIDDLFKDYLVEHQVKAPVNAWSRLHSELHPAPRRRLIYYTRLAAAAILLLIAFSAGYFYAGFNKPAQDEVALATEQSLQAKKQENKPGFQSETIQNQEIVNGKSNTADFNPEKKSSTANQQLEKNGENVSLAQNGTTPNPTEEPAKTISFSDPTENTIAEATALAEQSKNSQLSDESKQEIQGKPELMTPEMLHDLLVGDQLTGFMNEKEPDNDYTVWTVGARVSPVYSYRTTGGDGIETPDDFVDDDYFNNTEEGITTIGGGISLCYNFNDNLSLASGLYVSRIGLANSAVVAWDDPNGFGGSYKLSSSAGTVTINPRQFEMVMIEQPANMKDSIPGDYLVNGKFKQNMDYLEVPFVLNYRIFDRKIALNLNGGLSPGILVNNRSYFEVDGQKIQTGTTENLKPMIYNSLLGLSFEFSFSKNLIFSIEPTFKYSLTPINSNSGLNYHPYSMSWFTGISYKL